MFVYCTQMSSFSHRLLIEMPKYIANRCTDTTTTIILLGNSQTHPIARLDFQVCVYHKDFYSFLQACDAMRRHADIMFAFPESRHAWEGLTST